MAKGILEFDLTEPFEHSAFKRAAHATDAYLALHDIQQDMLRKRYKYDDSLSDEQHDLVETMYEEFFRILEYRGVNMDDLE
jgi:hypothetical protein